ncbi:response regulator transcription factor [Poseidonibacter lekithochrous]|uniref:response regulator transcription factor n=1 Tax=Poseidonibacter lekithochrous TaxID=1904463 RepID=UPI0008FC9F37|nr:response regulator transcription factor [Poseidonibacter lekithochrous]QKJ22996.1 two-component system response regulator [Poseidonibacter lekithochrous]
MKILLLEDDNFICESIKSYFELDGNKVDFFNDGEELLDNAILTNYDIFLFDINTPKKNGFETLKAIRDDGISTPAIYLTAQSDIEHVKQGYALGCSDYVRKPFILDELELRINQILHKDLDSDNVKITESYSFNLCSMQLAFEGESIDLKQQEKDLLYILVKNIGNIVSPSIIKDYVWDEKDVCDNTLRTQIKKIRTKLKENFIVNIRNSGYKIEKNA